ncbi:type I pantothenate kinase [Vagococcus carniphilus]|uniref:Pantothenate kinase n=1 Tax=Vagococcus carniphilus TaxID=218144 RepID=A0A430B6R3_9ENTE|nr:type I pantothenate kinase [Vagococcus carniphilus]MDT2816160.1 type I pantothenate kinase [Vagococcus carniphilus]MDT2831154.1 type I pantothenate kinase [Vagococcus carniphilus]MDT2833341.1 type I pantothenate kinase [Vagococcus carniphilus]MDT2839687.1 type I pantothenate kinase [Vagococcus carniphilus]MDT2849127.1 type I pantothenate kinase [Vagococcus carniphilus]
MDERTNYYHLTRDEWRSFYRNGIAPLSDTELQQIKGFNDQISLQDVQEIYIPLTHLIHIYMKEYDSLHLSKGLFMQEFAPPAPFIIGVAGSVAVGKSTTARLLQMMLSRTFKRRNVQLITTDGFLYPTDELIKRDILDKKGFPESYDMERLLNFLNAVKNGEDDLKIPKYSHEIYDIIPDEFELITQPDILIVEGINVLQLPANQQIYVSDFFDFSVFVDAEPDLIESWYLERFEALLNLAKDDKTNYYYEYANGPRDAALGFAKKIWQDVNLKNLEQFILPTRSRADVVIHKTNNHTIDEISLRKF